MAGFLRFPLGLPLGTSDVSLGVCRSFFPAPVLRDRVGGGGYPDILIFTTPDHFWGVMPNIGGVPLREDMASRSGVVWEQ
jgi:hypothetical protein